MSEDIIRVLVVDDHEMVRLGIISYLETDDGIEVVGQAGNGREAVERAKQLRPDVILMDLVMEGMDGIAATREIVSFRPEAKVIILTSYIDDEMVFPALEAGAVSYLLKTARAEEVSNAVRAAFRNEAIFDQKVAGKLMKRVRREQPLHAALTPRESDVLKLIADGKNNQEIADELYIGVKTVKTHVSNILSKLELSDRTQIAVYAHKNGLANDTEGFSFQSV